jgi:NAD(P)H-dependent flavin oxidoreductase YrpB (nitropropane dioxygenase family)
MARVQRNAVIERWAGREWAIRQNRADISRAIAEARAAGDVDNATLLFGQYAGLIDAVIPAAEIIERMAREADDIVRKRLAERPGSRPCVSSPALHLAEIRRATDPRTP